jgi:uridylate kinase
MKSSGRKTPYRRVLIKLSGEALSGPEGFGVDVKRCDQIAQQVVGIAKLGVQVALVIGGGNIFRGVKGIAAGMARTPADHIGMLATFINGIALHQAFLTLAWPSSLISAIRCDTIAESYSWSLALKYLEQNQILIFVGGTGNPFFTTDSAAALRALEIEAEILIKATKVDGIFTEDPTLSSNAELYSHISYREVLSRNLRVMDLTAITLCATHSLPIQVCNIFNDEALLKVINKEPIGTLVTESSDLLK